MHQPMNNYPVRIDQPPASEIHAIGAAALLFGVIGLDTLGIDAMPEPQLDLGDQLGVGVDSTYSGEQGNVAELASVVIELGSNTEQPPTAQTDPYRTAYYQTIAAGGTPAEAQLAASRA
jgi:hypothetical protein